MKSLFGFLDEMFFDDKKKIVEYYFDIIKESGVDDKTKIPYFIDAYLDIAILSTGNIKILDLGKTFNY